MCADVRGGRRVSVSVTISAECAVRKNDICWNVCEMDFFFQSISANLSMENPKDKLVAKMNIYENVGRKPSGNLKPLGNR